MDLDKFLSRGLYEFTALGWTYANLPAGTRFVPSKLHRTIANVLEGITSGERNDTVINVPPGMGKSVLTGVFWPAWVWTFDPSHRWFYASYDLDLLQRDTACLQALISSRWYTSRWGQKLRAKNPALSKFEVVGGGARFNTSVRGAGTGWHCHTLVVDDPNKAQDALKPQQTDLEFAWDVIDTVLSSRAVDAARFRKVLIAQRIDASDCSFRALEQGWEHVCLPMRFVPSEADPLDWREKEGELLFPERFPEEFVSKLERSSHWDAQYQQRPGSANGPIFDASMFVGIDDVPSDGLPMQSWDLTFKGNSVDNDWIAGQRWVEKGGFYFLTHPPVFQRAGFVQTLKIISDRIELWPARKILIEGKANGPAIEDAIKLTAPGLIELVEPEGDKTSRAASISPLFATGKVKLCQGPHVKRWQTIWPSFPKVKRDDEIDAASQYLRFVWKSALPRDRLARLLEMR